MSPLENPYTPAEAASATCAFISASWAVSGTASTGPITYERILDNPACRAMLIPGPIACTASANP